MNKKKDYEKAFRELEELAYMLIALKVGNMVLRELALEEEENNEP